MDSPFRFVVPAPDIVWRSRVEAGASVYLVGTSLEFVTPESPRDRELIEEGALRVATLRFDADPRERSHRGRIVQLLDQKLAARQLPGLHSSN
jgi:hypothetical protein